MMTYEIEKVKEQDKSMKYNALVAPDALNMDEDRALMALTKAKSELENYYRACNGSSFDSKWGSLM